MFSSLSVKDTLLHDISLMADNSSAFSKRPGIDFSRSRKLDFKSLLHFQLSMEGGSINQELLKYFSFSSFTPTVSAFLQQRSKLNPNTFEHLFHQFLSHFPLNLYKDKYLLLACDGSTFTYTRAPLDVDSYYAPDGKSLKGFNQLHLIALFDLLSQRYCDAILQPIRKKNEFLALSTLMDRFQCPSAVPIFIADRGFHSYHVFAHAIEQGSFFLIRAKDINTKRLLGKEEPETDTYDVDVSRILSRTRSKRKHLHPEREDDYRFICKSVAFDYINDYCPEYTLSLRVIRIKISEEVYENIITNLPRDEFPTDELKKLYALRWGIETSFCKLKHTIGAQNLHSKTYEFITHELWARLILYNFCAVITEQVTIKGRKRKYQYQINYNVAFNACHYLLKLHKGEEPPNIEGLIGQYILPVRPGRTYARQHRYQIPISFTYRFS